MKKGHIFLSGGGDMETSYEVDEKYFSSMKNNGNILYIPVALDRKMAGFEACYDWFSSLVSKHINDKEIDFSMLVGDKNVPNLNSFDSIYIGGGNTYKLLDYVYKNELNKKIIRYIKEGGIVYGGSAGAIILGKDIRTVEEENNKNYAQSEGLDLLDSKSVICHYDGCLDQKILDAVKKIGSEILALPENSGLILDSNGKIEEVVGDVYLFDEKVKRKI